MMTRGITSWDNEGGRNLDDKAMNTVRHVQTPANNTSPFNKPLLRFIWNNERFTAVLPGQEFERGEEKKYVT